MSTRSVIARGEDSYRWEGRYHHSDGYPDGLGARLYEIYQGHFQKDLKAMLKFLIDDHPAGWSTILNCNFDKPAGFYPWPDDMDWSDPKTWPGPRCYCHGQRNHEPMTIRPDDPIGCVYAYIIQPDGAVQVLAQKAYTMGSHIPIWTKVGDFDLNATEIPDILTKDVNYLSDSD